MIEKFNKNAKVDKFTNILGIAVRLIIIDPCLEFSNENALLSQQSVHQVQKWNVYLSYEEL